MNKIYYDWKEIQGAILDIARQINNSDWRPDYIVGIGRGGLVPATLLSHYMDIKMISLDISLRDGGECVSNCGCAEEAYEGVNILVVDDINDTGNTIEWIKKDWQSSAHPHAIRWPEIWHKSVRFATLTNNLASKEDVDYTFWEVNKAEQDCWLVYPWEEFWK